MYRVFVNSVFRIVFFSQTLMRFLSVLYCLLLIILGFSFPVAELTADKLENNYYQVA